MSGRDGTDNSGAVAPAAPGIGHNGPPVPLFGLRAAWLKFAQVAELRRLAKLHLRIERRKAGLEALVHERQRIMKRCIRRMRRHDGRE